MLVQLHRTQLRFRPAKFCAADRFQRFYAFRALKAFRMDDRHAAANLAFMRLPMIYAFAAISLVAGTREAHPQFYDGQTDIGHPAHPGKVEFNTQTGTYTV